VYGHPPRCDYRHGVGATVSVSREISASPEELWSLVTDLTRMGEWSPENEGGEWLDGATGPSPGARFRGHNRNGSKQWSMLVTVIDVDEPRRFAFRTSMYKVPSASWTYEFEPSEAGCIVTESWSDQRWSWTLPFSKQISGVTDRESHTREGIARTLANLAAAVEGTDVDDD